jgi:tetratricopeptide (TPR) repeat protein/serine/threonine protein kinase
MNDFRREYLVRLPLPLAQLYSRAHNDKSARSRHDNAYYLFEALVKLSAAPAIMVYLHEVEQGQPRVPAVDQVLGGLALPSFGHWVGMLRELARYFGSRADAASHPLGHLWQQLDTRRRDLPATLALYGRTKNGVEGAPGGDTSCSLLELITALVQYRNDVFGHGGPRFESFYEQDMGPLLFPALTEVLAEGVLDLLGPRGSRLLHLAEMRLLDDGRMEVGVRELVGLRVERAEPLLLTAETAARLTPGRLAVLWPGQTVPLRLDPLLFYRETPASEEVLFLNRSRTGKHVEYLSYTRGEPELERSTVTEMRALLGRVASGFILEESVRMSADESPEGTNAGDGAGRSTTTRMIGDYELLAELGQGGMGVVYLAEQRSLGRLVALKTLRAEKAGDAVAMARFQREIRALARCDHPHIVKVLASGKLPDGQLYYTMEYVPGCTLEQVWRELSVPGSVAASRLDSHNWSEAVLSASRKQRSQTTTGSHSLPEETGPTKDTKAVRLQMRLPPLPSPPERPTLPGDFPRKMTELMRDAALALQAVHDQGLIHRDVKPGNLMLTPDGERIVLMDFGLVKGDSATLPESRAGGLLGTLRYAAPEQLAATTVPVGAAADVRGLGGTFWELFTRRRLFGEAGDEKQLATVVLQADVPRLREVDAGFNRDLEAIMARATERRVSDRIPTAARLAEYLQLSLDDKPLPIRPPGIRELVWRWVRTHQMFVGSFVAGLTAVVLAVVLALVLIGQKQELARRVNADLQEVAKLQAQGKLGEARAVLQHAIELVAVEGTPQELRNRVREAQADLETVARLQEAVLLKSIVKGDAFNASEARAAFVAAMTDCGVDLLAVDPGPSVERIAASPIREWLIEALDEFADWLNNDERDRLFVLAQAADKDEDRKAIRDALRRNGREELQRLAAGPKAAALPPINLRLLGAALLDLGKEEQGLALLRLGQRRFPADFWLNHQLGYFLTFKATPAQPTEAVACFRAALAVRSDSPGVYMNLGTALGMTGDWVAAEEAYRQALALKSDYAYAHIGLGDALDGQKKLQEAEDAYRAALRLRPGSSEAHNRLGLVLSHRGDFHGAVAAYREAIRLDNNNASAYVNLGSALSDLNDVPGAIEAHRDAIRVDKTLAGAHYALGNALQKQGNAAGAIAAYREAIRLEPTFSLAHNNLGLVLLKESEVQEGLAALGAAIHYDKNEIAGYINVVEALLELGEPNAALLACREAIRLDKNRPESQNALGVALSQMGDTDGAIAAFREALRLNPRFANAYFNMGNHLKRKGDLTGAVAAYRQALEINKDDAGFWYSLAIALAEKVSTRPEAVAAYREAIRLKRDYYQAHCNLGILLEKMDDLIAAEAALREALRWKATDYRSHYALGNVLETQGKLSDAAESFRAATREQKENARAPYALGNVLRKLKDIDGAIAAYREAIDRDVNHAEAHCNLGLTLFRRGEFRTALAMIYRGHALGTKRRDWRYPSAVWLVGAEELLVLDHRLTAVLAGKVHLVDSGELLGMIILCRDYKAQPATAARLCAMALTERPALADELRAGLRVEAARVAVLAGTGQGKDGTKLNAIERARWRVQARVWLQADLAAWQRLCLDGNPRDRADAAEAIARWRTDPDLAGVRDGTALDKLPELERDGWKKLWAEVDALLARLKTKDGSTKTPTF